MMAGHGQCIYHKCSGRDLAVKHGFECKMESTVYEIAVLTRVE